VAPGDYVLTVHAVLGDYAFQVLDLASAAPLVPGETVSGVLDPSAETDAYRFTAEGGDKFYFDGISATATSYPVPGD